MKRDAAHTPRAITITTTASLFATWLIARKVLENWLYWIVVDSLQAVLFASQGLWSTALGWGEEELVETAAEQMRKLSFSHIFGGKSHEPAIALAEQGFKVSPRLHTLLQADAHLRKDPLAARFFYTPQGQAWPVGHVLRNPEYAHVLRRIAFEGSRALHEGPVAEAIVARIRRFVDRVREASPSTRIVFVSVNRAPEKRDRWDVVDAVNRQVEAYGRQTGRVRYVDVNPVLIDATGEPRMDLFMSDALHLRPAAYEGFTRILKPVLEQAYANR